MDGAELRIVVTQAMRSQFDQSSFTSQKKAIIEALIDLGYDEEAEDCCLDMIADGELTEKESLKLLKIKI